MAFSLIAHLNSSHPNNGGSASWTSGAIDTTGANLIVVEFSGDSPLSTDFSLADSNANVYTRVLGPRNVFFYCVSPIVGAGHTWTGTTPGGGVAPSLVVGAFHGVDTVTPINQAGNTANSTNVTASQTPSKNGCLVVCASGPNPGGNFTTVTGGAQVMVDIAPGISFGAYSSCMSAEIQTVAAPVQATFTPSGGSFANSSILIFNPAPTLITITPPAGALTFATFAPTPDLTGTITPPAGALTLATFSPLLTRNIPVPAGALTLATFAPMLGIVVGPVPTAALVLATFPPKLTFSFGPASGNHGAAWWWSGAAARMINDAGFQLLVEPHLQDESYTGEPQPIEGE